MHKRISFCLMILFMATSADLIAGDNWPTYCEKSNYLETPGYDETVAFCQQLADSFPTAKYSYYGISPQGRRMPLLIVDKDKEFDPAAARKRGKIILLLQAGIHAGEIEGKDAGLTLIRDILVKGKYAQSLDHVVLLFLPIFNVDGHERFSPYNRINQNGPKEMGWRATAQNLNLNRDYIKADTPEMRFWLDLFNRWLPDFMIDIHTTDGADFQYVITYGLETNANVAKPLADWCDNQYLPEIEKRMVKSGFPLSPYVVPRKGNDVTSGLMSFNATPRYSNGYGAVQNRPFLLIETHMLKPYKQRVESVYELVRNTISYLNENAQSYPKVVAASDSLTANTLTGKYLPVSFRPGRDSVMIDFLGYDCRFKHSDISDTTTIIWGKKKTKYHIPFFYKNAVADSILLPYAYLVPQEWQYQLNLLQLHGINVQYLAKDTDLTVDSYRFSDPKWSSEPFEGRHNLKINAAPIKEKRHYPAGTAVILMNQRTNRIIAQLLEPRAPDSFVSWGFFDTVFEQKEYAEDYVLEQMAPKMLSESPALKAEFEKKLASDTAFAKSSIERLQFFYERSPYYDSSINLYPIGKLTTQSDLPLR